MVMLVCGGGGVRRLEGNIGMGVHGGRVLACRREWRGRAPALTQWQHRAGARPERLCGGDAQQPCCCKENLRGRRRIVIVIWGWIWPLLRNGVRDDWQRYVQRQLLPSLYVNAAGRTRMPPPPRCSIAIVMSAPQ